jgi:hypothetical protein
VFKENGPMNITVASASPIISPNISFFIRITLPFSSYGNGFLLYSGTGRLIWMRFPSHPDEPCITIINLSVQMATPQAVQKRVMNGSNRIASGAG